LDGLLDQSDLFATSLDILHRNDRLEAWRTLLLNPQCVWHIHEARMGGGPDVHATIASVYAHRARFDD
jgi:hypothetical protein